MLSTPAKALRFLLILACASPLAAQSTEPEFSIGILTDNYPYAYQVEGDDRLHGFAVELLAAVEAAAQINLERRIGTTEEIHGAFHRREIDVLLTYAFSEQRARTLQFTPPYLEMQGAVYVRPEHAGVESFDDMKNLRIMVHPGSVGEEVLIANGLAANIIPAEGTDAALLGLGRGEGDATLATFLTGSSLIERYDLDLIATEIQVPEYTADYCFAAYRGNDRAIARLSEGLALVNRSGRYKEIYEKWFGRFEPRQFSEEDILMAVAGGLSIALIVALIAVAHQRRLRKQLAAAWDDKARSELHYQEVFDTTPVALLVTRDQSVGDNLSLALVESNPAADKLFRWQDPPPHVDLNHYAADFIPLWRAVSAVLPHTSPRSQQLEVKRADSTAVHLRWSAVRDESRVLVVVENISDMVRAAQELQSAERSLLQSQKLDALGTLASGIAHDFNNVLASILGNADLLRLDIKSDTPAAEAADSILTGARRARDLVKQILAFSRQAEPERRLVDLHHVVKETLALIRAASPRSIRLDYDESAHTPKVLADPTQIHQVLMNLCTNAVQSMGDGPGVLTVRLRQALQPSAKGQFPVPPKVEPGNYHCIDIADTGNGIAPEHLQRIFDPFFSTKQERAGTGLGLAVAHGILEKHAGCITVKTEIGRGTTMTVWLPSRDIEDVEAAQEPTSLAPIADRRVNAMLIDDEEPVRGALSRLLDRLGCDTEMFGNPEDAVAAFDRTPEDYDMVLCDLSMPEMSGLEVLTHLKAMRPTLPVLIMSGFWSNGTRAKARKLGATVLADKPLEFAELRRDLVSMLALKTDGEGI